MNDTKRLLSVGDVARELGIPIASVYGMLAPKGDLAAIRTRLGPGEKRRTRGRVYVAREDLEMWIANHRTAPASETTAIIARAASRRAILDLPGASRYAS